MGIKFSEGFRNEDHIQNNSNLDGLLNADINNVVLTASFISAFDSLSRITKKNNLKVYVP